MGLNLIPNEIPTSVMVGKVRLFPMSFLLGIINSQFWKLVQFPNWVLMFQLWEFVGNKTNSLNWDETGETVPAFSLIVGYFWVFRQIPFNVNLMGNLRKIPVFFSAVFNHQDDRTRRHGCSRCCFCYIPVSLSPKPGKSTVKLYFNSMNEIMNEVNKYNFQLNNSLKSHP